MLAHIHEYTKIFSFQLDVISISFCFQNLLVLLWPCCFPFLPSFLYSPLLVSTWTTEFCLFILRIKLNELYYYEDEVKMVLYSREMWNALFFIGCYWRTDVYKNGRSPALLFDCFGRGTSVARRDQGGSFALSRVMPGLLSEPIWCKKTEIGDEDSVSLRTYLDASRMYDWNYISYSATLPLSVACYLMERTWALLSNGYCLDKYSKRSGKWKTSPEIIFAFKIFLMDWF